MSTKRLRITDIHAREIIDCRGFPTVEVDIWINGELEGRADVPAGRSTGKREATEHRDGGKRWGGQGTRKAVKNVIEIIGPELVGKDPRDQRAIDSLICDRDGTADKSNLGANAILGISMATARAAAKHRNIPLYQHLGNRDSQLLPAPMMNILNGGSHADNNVDIQEFMVFPIGAKSFSDA